MPQSEESIGPLANGWRRLREQMLARKPRSEGELLAARLMFYYGASLAIRTAARSMMSLPLMAIEVREFEKDLREKAACQVESIS